MSVLWPCLYCTCVHCSFQATCKSLFWSLFGVVPMEAADVVINEYKKEIGNETVTVQNKHKVTEGIGFFLYGFYEVVTMIILLNLLIAMMSNTYTKIEVRSHSYTKIEVQSHSYTKIEVR